MTNAHEIAAERDLYAMHLRMARKCRAWADAAASERTPHGTGRLDKLEEAAHHDLRASVSLARLSGLAA